MPTLPSFGDHGLNSFELHNRTKDMFCNSSPILDNPPQKDLELANALLESARKTEDREADWVICGDAEDKLTSDEDEALGEGVASDYVELEELIDNPGQGGKARLNYKRAENLG